MRRKRRKRKANIRRCLSRASSSSSPVRGGIFVLNFNSSDASSRTKCLLSWKKESFQFNRRERQDLIIEQTIEKTKTLITKLHPTNNYPTIISNVNGGSASFSSFGHLKKKQSFHSISIILLFILCSSTNLQLAEQAAAAISVKQYNFEHLETPLLSKSSNLSIQSNSILSSLNASTFSTIGDDSNIMTKNSREQQQQQQQQQDEERDDILLQTKHGILKGTYLSMKTKLSKLSSFSNNNDSFKNTNVKTNDVIGFLGIRYASAPTKKLRFMPPAPYYYAQNQIHDMKQFGPICRQHLPINFDSLLLLLSNSTINNGNKFIISNNNSDIHQLQNFLADNVKDHHHHDLNQMQLIRLIKRLMPAESYAYLRPLIKQLLNFKQSEDCLNLNIYTPLEAIQTRVIKGGRYFKEYMSKFNNNDNKQQLLLPVLVVIHGESFDYGAGSTINGLKFVENNNLLVVTFNYRLNILGFPPKLLGASRGNLGLMDQVAALHWIKDNIQSFGGSPNNITLMGSKKGAIFVNLLMLSPMAKGLFNRAIMEDGSALTPFVANQILSSHSILNQNQLSLPPSQAIQHIRLLAKLSDCPFYLPTSSSSSSSALTTAVAGPTTTTNFVTNNIKNQNRPSLQITNKSNNSLFSNQQFLFSIAADESKANNLMFDCFRNKPIEKLMQRVPINLINNFNFNELTINEKLWFKWLQLLEPEVRQIYQSKIYKNNDNDNLIIIKDVEIINEIISKVTQMVLIDQLNEQENLIKTKNYSTKLNEEATNRGINNNKDLYELFDIIYAHHHHHNQQNNKSFLSSLSIIQPLFGPILDGTILPDEEIASLMLKQNSNFVQRDLLIGFSHPAIITTTTTTSNNNHLTSSSSSLLSNNKEKLFNESDNLIDLIVSERLMKSDINVKLTLDNLLAERISEEIELNGLNNDDAVEFVNLFVKSFYRYHNQEITNSIISNYLNSIVINRQAQKLRRKNLLMLKILKLKLLLSNKINATTSYGNYFNQNQNHNESESNLFSSIDSNELKQQQQVLVLNSLLQGFQDSLTNVPILKTALIHAIRQLDPLIDLFIDKQYEKFKLKDESSISIMNNNMLNNNNNEELLDSFIKFAQSIFEDFSNWPLELFNQKLTQPKATYLYEFDANILIKEIHFVINKIQQIILNYSIDKTIKLQDQQRQLSDENENSDIKNNTINTWITIKDLIINLLIKLQSDNFINRINLNCLLDSTFQIREEQQDEDLILFKFIDWICVRFSKTLKNFIYNGNVNNRKIENGEDEEINNNPNSIYERIQLFSIKSSSSSSSSSAEKNNCFQKLSKKRFVINDNDHHLVQPSINNSNNDDEDYNDNILLLSSTNRLNSSRDKFMNSFVDYPKTFISNDFNELSSQSNDNNCYQQLNQLAFDYLISQLSYPFAGSKTTTSKNQLNDNNNNNNNWPVFNVLTQEFATLPNYLDSLSDNNDNNKKWKLNSLLEIENENINNNVYGSFLSRSSFWSNFIPALNCTKTQPINPLSLIGGVNLADQTSSYSNYSIPLSSSDLLLRPKIRFSGIALLNSTIMNMNLLFSCQQQQQQNNNNDNNNIGESVKTAHDIIQLMFLNIKNQLQNKINNWLAINKSSSSMNHHSLRMANLSQSNSVAELELNLEQQLDSNGNNNSTTNNEFILEQNNYSKPAKLANNNIEQQNSLSSMNRISLFFFNSIQSIRYTLFISCSLLISITLIIFYINRKKNINIKNEIESKSKNNNNNNNITKQVIDNHDNSSCSNNINNNQLESDDKNSINNPYSIQNMIVNGNVVQFEETAKNGNNNNNIVQNRIDEQNSNHVYAINNNNNFDHNRQKHNLLDNNNNDQQLLSTYWTNNNGDTITLCRSHSSLSMSNGSTIVENLQKIYSDNNNKHKIEQLICPDERDNLIMSMLVPANEINLENEFVINGRNETGNFNLNYGNNFTKSGVNCLSSNNNNSSLSNGHYGGSSSETQNQSSLSSSQTTTTTNNNNNSLNRNTKKRVKIRDPLYKGGDMTYTLGRNYNINSNQGSSQQLFCPVHHIYSDQQQQQQQQQSVDDTTILTTLNPNSYFIDEGQILVNNDDIQYIQQPHEPIWMETQLIDNSNNHIKTKYKNKMSSK